MLLLTPGPTPIPERVQKALLRPMRGHLDPEVLRVNRAIQERLAALFDPGEGALVAALAAAGLPHVRMLLQVHDELVLEVRNDALERVTEAVRGCMVVAGQGALRVPLKVDVGRGTNWDEAH